MILEGVSGDKKTFKIQFIVEPSCIKGFCMLMSVDKIMLQNLLFYKM